VGNHPGFAGARAGENQQWTIHRFDGGTLLRVQLIKQMLQWLVSEGEW
jgi:hypothetical protein